jgi:hypothetical protein
MWLPIMCEEGLQVIFLWVKENRLETKCLFLSYVLVAYLLIAYFIAFHVTVSDTCYGFLALFHQFVFLENWEFCGFRYYQTVIIVNLDQHIQIQFSSHTVFKIGE